MLTRLLTVSLTLVLGLALVVAWVRVVRTLRTPPAHTGLTGKVSSVVWDGRVFTTRTQLRSFLEARGVSYTRWAKAHPSAFTGRKPPATAARTAAAQRAKPNHGKAAKPAAVGSSAQAAHGSRVLPGLPGGSTLVTVAIAALALAAAVLLFRSAGSLLPRAGRIVRRLDAEARVTAFAAGLAVLLGLAVARLFS